MLLSFPDASGAATPEEVLALTRAAYARLETVSGSVTVTLERPGHGTTVARATFAFSAPNRLRMTYAGTDPQVIVSDGTVCYRYFPAADRGEFRLLAAMSPVERFAWSPAARYGDILGFMANGSDVRIDSERDGMAVLRFVPRNPSYIGTILAGIDTGDWTVRTVEYYDRADNLMCQVEYSDFSGDTGVRVPARATVLQMTAWGLQREETVYSDLRVNEPLPPGTFSMPGGNATAWVDSDTVAR